MTLTRPEVSRPRNSERICSRSVRETNSPKVIGIMLVENTDRINIWRPWFLKRSISPHWLFSGTAATEYIGCRKIRFSNGERDCGVTLYDAFISYSHAKDKPVAAVLQTVIQRLGKPWYRRRALRVFRDDTSLSATPQLWPAIESMLQECRYLILLASPQAAASHWVNKEVAWWLEHKSLDTLLIAVTEGELSWDPATGESIPTEVTILPPALAGRLSEPKWVDLRAYRDGADPRNAHFTSLAADFAAAIHGVPKEDLLSQEVRQQRRALSLAWTAAGTLLVLAGLTGWQWREAIAQRNRAERTLAAATETTNGLVTKLALRFKNITGVPATVIKEIFDQTRELQEQLLSTGEVSAPLRRSYSRALNFSADTLQTVGDNKAALAAAEKARGILQQLLTENPNDPDWQVAFASSYNRIGLALRDLGRTEEALAAYRTTIGLLKALLVTNPGATPAERDLALVYSRIGYLMDDQGKFGDALESFNESLAIHKTLVAQNPDNNEYKADLAGGFRAVGLQLLRNGKLDEALSTFREALAIAKALSEKEPTSTIRKSALANIQRNTGDVFKERGNFDDALAAYQEAREINKKRVAADAGDTAALRDLVVQDESIGDLLVLLRRYDEASATYREGLDAAKSLVGKDPTNVTWQRDLGVGFGHLGDVLRTENKLDEALSAFLECKRIFTALLTVDPDNKNSTEALVFVGYRIAGVLAQQDKFDEAFAAYDEALAIAKALVESDPENGRWRNDLAIIYERIGNAREGHGEFDKALAAYQECSAIQESLVAKAPANNWWRRQLVNCLNNVGNVLSEQTKFEQAIQTWDKNYKNIVYLLAKEPGNALWQRDLTYVVRQLADTLFLVGRPEDGLPYFEKPLQLAADDTVLRWARARVALYGGRPETARDDLEAIINLRPANGNAILWLQVALMQIGQYDRQDFEKRTTALDTTKWPFPIIAFYLGNGDLMTVKEAVQINDKLQKERRCDTDFFLGVFQLHKGPDADAHALLTSAAENCGAFQFSRAAAAQELKRTQTRH